MRSLRQSKLVVILAGLLLAGQFSFFLPTQAATVKPAIPEEIQKLTPAELEQQLKDRAAKLQDINNQISQTKQSLDGAIK